MILEEQHLNLMIIFTFSSVFDEEGDAEGQYDYPESNSLKGCKHKPNPSFDLLDWVQLLLNILNTKMYLN